MHLTFPIFYLHAVSVEFHSLANSQNISFFESTKQGTQLLGWNSSCFWLMGIWAQGKQGI